MVAAFTACGSGGGKSSAKIKMTTEAGGEFIFHLAGSGTATVDWGDGSEKVTLTLLEDIYPAVQFRHTYPSATIRTIIVNGDNITGLSCGYITSLDVSRNTELKYLDTGPVLLKSLDVSKNVALTVLQVGGDFTSLDLSKNTALTYLKVAGGLSVSTLNALFGTLHNNTVSPAEGQQTAKIINIRTWYGEDFDRSIAERKGWTFQN